MSDDIQIERVLKVPNVLGMHARAAARLAKCCADFTSTIKIISDVGEFDAKSILDLMSLGAAQGTDLSFRLSGGDAENAFQAIEQLFQQNLGDDDSEFNDS